MSIELAIPEVRLATANEEVLFCDIEIGDIQTTLSVPSLDYYVIQLPEESVESNLYLRLRGEEVIGTIRLNVKELGDTAKWYSLKTANRGMKFIQRTSAAAVKIQVRKQSLKGHRYSTSLSSSPFPMRDLRIPSKLSDNPNPSPPQSLSPILHSPKDITQALTSIDTKVRNFHTIDDEMGKIQQKLAGLIGSINSLETSESNESRNPTSPHWEKLADVLLSEVSGEEKTEESEEGDRLGTEIRKTLSGLRSHTCSRGSPVLYDLDELKQELHAMTILHHEQQQELENLRKVQKDTMEALRANGAKDKTIRQELLTEKETVSNLNKQLQAAEEALRSAKNEILSLKSQLSNETIAKISKTQSLKLTLTPPVPDFTHIFEVQLAHHKELCQKYDTLFQECRKHREQIEVLERKLASSSTDLQLSKEKTGQLESELATMKQVAGFLEQENQKLKCVGLASVARAQELYDLSHDLTVFSNLSLLQSEKALSAHIVIAKLTALLRKQEEELEKYRNVALPKYKAADPEDQTDVALERYLSDKLVQVPFLREESGVYRFGTKKVFVRLEQGNIIIRVGGGYMHLDEFIDIYTPIELGKMDGKPEDAIRTALAKKLIEQLDEKFVPCFGLNKVPQ